MSPAPWALRPRSGARQRPVESSAAAAHPHHGPGARRAPKLSAAASRLEKRRRRRRAGPAPLSRLAALQTPLRVVPGSPAAAGWEVHHGLGALPEAASSQPACGAGRALGSPNRPPPPAPARPFSPRRGGGNRGTCCAAPARERPLQPSRAAAAARTDARAGRGTPRPPQDLRRRAGVPKESALGGGSEGTRSSSNLKSHRHKGPHPGHTGSP